MKVLLCLFIHAYEVDEKKREKNSGFCFLLFFLKAANYGC